MDKYPKYKPSGIDWIGDIPEHWGIQRLKYGVSYEKGKNPKELSFEEKGKVYLTMEYLRGNPKQIFFIEKFTDCVNVEENRILLLWDGSNAGEFIKSREGVLSSTMAALKLKDVNTEFAWYFFKSFERILKEGTIGMGIPHVNGDDFKNHLFVFPPHSEQAAIAEYLDEKTAQIDDLVVKKQKLIELLMEERTAVINHAVTKGIDPNVRLKPSGIDWLGDIPEHWEVKKLKYVAKIQSSNVDKKTVDNEQPIRLCNYVDVYKNEFIDDAISFMTATASQDEIERFILRKGDVIITKDSETPDDIANPALVTTDLQDVICAYHLAQIRPRAELLGKYLFRLFQSKQFNSHFEISANGVTRFGLPLDAITDVCVFLPPIREQEIITDYIQSQSQKIDEIIAKETKSIELLQEYRTALISDVVTGKVNVLAGKHNLKS